MSQLQSDHGRVPGQGRLIEIGCGQGDFLFEAKSQGYTVEGLELSKEAAEHANKNLDFDTVLVGTLASVDLPLEVYDICVLADVIEHVRDPVATISYISRILKPGGAVFISTPNTASAQARLMGSLWMQLKLEHLFYFNPASMAQLLARAGFHETKIESGWKSLTADYIAGHFEKYPVPGVSWAVLTATGLLPRSIRERPVSVIAGGMYILGLKR